MAIRAKSEEVSKLIDNASDNIDFFVRVANTVVDELLLGQGLSEALLALIETFLAAHFATLAIEKGALAEKGIGEAREKYHNIYKAGFSSTRYGQQAILLDSTGSLAEATSIAETTTVKKALFTVVTSAGEA